MPPKKNILAAMFDIRPAERPGVVDFAKISNLKQKVNLRLDDEFVVEADFNKEPIWSEPEMVSYSNSDTRNDQSTSIIKEFESAVSASIDPIKEFKKIGGKLVKLKKSVQHPYVIPAEFKQDLAPKETFYPPAEIIEVSEPVKHETQEIKVDQSPRPRINFEPGANELEKITSNFKNIQRETEKEEQIKSLYRSNQNLIDIRPRQVHRSRKVSRLSMWLIPVAIIGFWFFQAGGFNAKSNIETKGVNGISNLQQAKDDLKQFDFSGAANSFALAYDDFSKASSALNKIGGSFLSIFSNIPGLNKLGSAGNLINAGQNLSKAGQDLASAFDTLSKTNIFAYLNSGNDSQKQSLTRVIFDFKNSLKNSLANITEAQTQLSGVDISSVPKDKQVLLEDFKDKIPEMKNYISQALDYSDFMLSIIGSNTKTYLILLQNNSELRATGGFPGSYALVTFEGGTLKKIFVDDIYNPDSQMKESIIPPGPMQHITPNWGMRDANWFADFPTSARKVEDLYAKSGGVKVDGVMTITPDVISKMLDVVGPIEMPEYQLTLTSKNFIDQIQDEVEYGANRNQPKTVLKDLEPKFFAKLAQQDKENWVKIFQILSDAANQKQILAYFNDTKAENESIQSGLGGEIKSPNSDYLEVVFSNIKGSKTDAVIRSSFDLNVQPAEAGIGHALTITRVHDGGKSQYPFYNKQSPTYVRVYVPKGSRLDDISGYTKTDFRPIIGYPDYPSFKKDSDLAAIEKSTTHPFTGVDVFNEGDKTVFGFWMVINPGKTGIVTLNYTTAETGSSEIYWEKQSGTSGFPITFSYQKSTPLSSDLTEDHIFPFK